MRVLRILAISGSLRRASSNAALVEAAVRLAPRNARISIYTRLEFLPPFNPDRDTELPLPAVADLRAALQASDALLISSPEYAHGVSGVLKNALDWVVSSGELIDKPVALVNASARAGIAHAALRETLVTMSARFVDAASIVVSLDGRGLDANGIVGDAALAARLASALETLALAVR